MTFDIKNILLISGLLIYTTNYIIGWGLYFKKITMTKRTHQFFFAGIIVNLILLLFFIPFLSQNFFICLASLAAMFVLPLGRKGGVYHRAVSTLGLMLYILILVF